MPIKRMCIRIYTSLLPIYVCADVYAPDCTVYGTHTHPPNIHIISAVHTYIIQSDSHIRSTKMSTLPYPENHIGTASHSTLLVPLLTNKSD